MRDKLKCNRIRFFLLIGMFIAIGSLCLAVAFADDELEETALVPIGLPIEQYQKLEMQKQELDKRKARLLAQVATLNSECSHVSSRDQGRVASCQQQNQEIHQKISSYNDDLHAYDAAIEEAKKAPPSPMPHVVIPYTPSNNAKYVEDKTKLENEYWDLDDQISKEKDPVKRAELINKQTYVKSQIGVLEIEILDQFREEQGEKRSTKINNLLSLSMDCALGSAFDASLRLLNQALNEAPGDKGIQEAINYVNYIKDMETGKIEPNPKYGLLVDALSYGQGDWNTTIFFVKRALDANPGDLAIRDALKVIEGMNTYIEDSLQDREKYTKPESPEFWQRFNDSQEHIRTHDYKGAYQILQEMHRTYPGDLGIRDVMNLVKGFSAEQQSPTKIVYPAKVKEKVYPWQKSDIDKTSSKIIQHVCQGDFEGAVPLLKQLRKLAPDELPYRDLESYIEGRLSEQRARQNK